MPEVEGYKAFDKSLCCDPTGNKPFQYEIGKEYIAEGEVEPCKNGFHFCRNPLDLFKYKSAAGRFCKVTADGCIDSDNKTVCRKIKVGAELSLGDILKAGFKFIFEKIDFNSPAANSGDRGTAANSGYSGTAANSGYSGTAANSGDRGTAANSGYSGTAANSGDRGTAANSGDRGTAANSGDRGTAANSGYSGTAANSGYSGTAMTTCSNSFAISTGYEGKASGVLGSYIAVAEWTVDNGHYVLKGFRTHKVDGKTIRPNTFYTLKSNRFVEVKE